MCQQFVWRWNKTKKTKNKKHSEYDKDVRTPVKLKKKNKFIRNHT